MKFQILISTMNGNFFDHNITVPADYLVINQYSCESIEKENIFNFKEKGLSRSRNHALSKSQAEIVLISDDDIHYMENIENLILEAFKNHPDADIITFQIQTPEKQPYKQYKSTKFWHNTKTLMGVCSVEIAFRLSSISKHMLEFDEHFGLGTKFPTGEENIFLIDALKKGLKVLYLPLPIVIHPAESSGMHYDNIALTQAKGAMFYRIFGVLGYAISVLFAYKKYKESRHTLSKFVTIMFQGIKQYRSNL